MKHYTNSKYCNSNRERWDYYFKHGRLDGSLTIGMIKDIHDFRWHNKVKHKDDERLYKCGFWEREEVYLQTYGFDDDDRDNCYHRIFFEIVRLLKYSGNWDPVYEELKKYLKTHQRDLDSEVRSYYDGINQINPIMLTLNKAMNNLEAFDARIEEEIEGGDVEQFVRNVLHEIDRLSDGSYISYCAGELHENLFGIFNGEVQVDED